MKGWGWPQRRRPNVCLDIAHSLVRALSILVPISCISATLPPLSCCRYEFGSALFIGWGATGLTMLGGSLLCCSCPPKERRGQRSYRQSQPSTAREYV